MDHSKQKRAMVRRARLTATDPNCTINVLITAESFDQLSPEEVDLVLRGAARGTADALRHCTYTDYGPENTVITIGT